jgi:uncharacterized membrane protein
MNLTDIVLVTGGTLTGLSAGVYYTFNVAVIPALHARSAKEHIAAMQAINIRIINPVFMLSFLGPSVLLPLAAVLHRDSARLPLLIAAAGLHIIGVNGVTMAGNVPLNDGLAKVNLTTLDEAEAEQIRQTYQGQGSSWMRLHNLRTMATIAATALVFIACLVVNSAEAGQ